MTIRFDPKKGLIIVPAEVEGPAGSAILRLAFDTGATSTVISAAPLAAIGCEMLPETPRIELTTGSGVEFAPRIQVSS